MARRKRTPPPLAEMAARAQEAELAQQELPHLFLLRVMRGEPIAQYYISDLGKIVKMQWVPSKEERLDAAKAAAPYHAPKLQAVRHTGADDGPIRVKEELTDVEVARRIAFALLRGTQQVEETVENGP